MFTNRRVKIQRLAMLLISDVLRAWSTCYRRDEKFETLGATFWSSDPNKLTEIFVSGPQNQVCNVTSELKQRVLLCYQRFYS